MFFEGLREVYLIWTWRSLPEYSLWSDNDMKKYILMVTYFLTFMICISLITGCSSSRMNDQTDKNRSARKSDPEDRTESVSNEQKSEPTNTEQWSERAKNKRGSDENSDNEQPSEESYEDPGEKAEMEHIKELYGTWYIWIPSSAQNLYDEETGGYVTHEFAAGSDSGKISIKENGTYSMRHDLWGRDETVKGKWRLSSPEEINGESAQTIILINGIGGIDWAVAPSPSGKIRLLYESEWDEKSSLWIFDSELYKN